MLKSKRSSLMACCLPIYRQIADDESVGPGGFGWPSGNIKHDTRSYRALGDNASALTVAGFREKKKTKINECKKRLPIQTNLLQQVKIEKGFACGENIVKNCFEKSCKCPHPALAQSVRPRLMAISSPKRHCSEKINHSRI